MIYDFYTTASVNIHSNKKKIQIFFYQCMLYRVKRDPRSCEGPSERGERERKRERERERKGLEDETGSFQDRWGIVGIYKIEDRRIPNSGEALLENIYNNYLRKIFYK